MNSTWTPLPREEVRKAVERRGPARIPLVQTHWWGEGLEEQYGKRLREFDRFPQDADLLMLEPVIPSEMGLSWSLDEGGGHDNRRVIDDWAKLDEFLEKLPEAKGNYQFERLQRQYERVRREGRYLLYGWWRLFYERPWGLRGMENLLVDLYTEPENMAKLYTALCDQYIAWLEYGVSLFKPDGFWTSDDLGTQISLMMPPDVFRSMIKPYYVRIGEFLRKHNMHWWLHSCGNNTDILGDLADAGVNVFHPVQKGTMDEVSVARDFGNRMAFLAGIDVQHTLQEKDPEGVREEVRFLIDTFDRPDGGMCIAAGNGIVAGTPFENIEAFLDEALVYGAKHRRQFA
jgi:uroporphyrinogen decarboxylase